MGTFAFYSKYYYKTMEFSFPFSTANHEEQLLMTQEEIVSWIPTVVPIIYLAAFALVVYVGLKYPRQKLEEGKKE